MAINILSSFKNSGFWPARMKSSHWNHTVTNRHSYFLLHPFLTSHRSLFPFSGSLLLKNVRFPRKALSDRITLTNHVPLHMSPLRLNSVGILLMLIPENIGQDFIFILKNNLYKGHQPLWVNFSLKLQFPHVGNLRILFLPVIYFGQYFHSRSVEMTQRSMGAMCNQG